MVILNPKPSGPLVKSMLIFFPILRVLVGATYLGLSVDGLREVLGCLVGGAGGAPAGRLVGVAGVLCADPSGTGVLTEDIFSRLRLLGLCLIADLAGCTGDLGACFGDLGVCLGEVGDRGFGLRTRNRISSV